MLTFKSIDCSHFAGYDTYELLKHNFSAVFEIKAPLYWWVDIDWIKYFLNMPLDNFEFCFDAFPGKELLKDFYDKFFSSSESLSPKQIMQVLPLSTYVTATVIIPYNEIVDVCENYLAGEFKYDGKYGFPCEREWVDFCETLMDIKGIRDIVKEAN